MAQRNLGAALTDIYNVTQDAAKLHPRSRRFKTR